MKLTRPAQCGAALLACVLVMGCDAPAGSAGPVDPTPLVSTSALPGTSASTPAPTTATKPPTAGSATQKGDVIPLTRSIKSGGIVVNVKYSTAPAVARWTLDGPKAIRISLNVVNNAHPSQKVYLTKVTVGFRSDAYAGDLPGATPVVDDAAINPGFLVAYPYRYDQSFDAPSIEPGLPSLRFDFKYELVTLVDKKAKDYTKQAVSDSVNIELPF